MHRHFTPLRKAIFKLFIACLIVLSVFLGARALNRYFEKMRHEDLPAGNFPSTYGHFLGIPEEYLTAFNNCHRFLWQQQSITDPFIVDDQERENLAVSILQPEQYESVTLCDVPSVNSVIDWRTWLEVLPALKDDVEYWDFCYPVAKILYKDPYAPDMPTFEKTGDFAHIIVDSESNKVVGYIFPSILND